MPGQYSPAGDKSNASSHMSRRLDEPVAMRSKMSHFGAESTLTMGGGTDP